MLLLNNSTTSGERTIKAVRQRTVFKSPREYPGCTGNIDVRIYCEFWYIDSMSVRMGFRRDEYNSKIYLELRALFSFNRKKDVIALL